VYLTDAIMLGGYKARKLRGQEAIRLGSYEARTLGGYK